MSRIFTASTIVIVLALICCVSVRIQAADRKFKVSSYIPDKFEDFLWLISGGTGLESDSRSFASFPSQESTFYSYDRNTDNKGYLLDLSTGLLYGRQTISQTIEFAAVLTGSVVKSDANDVISLESVYDSNTYTVDNDDDREYAALFEGEFEVDHYLLSNLFLHASGFARLDFRELESTVDTSHTAEINNGFAGSVTTDFNRLYYRKETTVKDHFIEGRLMLGWGRVYEGRHGATALSIVETLRQQDLLLHRPTFDQMQELSKLVHRCREAFPVDDRHHRITSLDLIISYLIEIGVIGDPGSYGHLLIQDVWDYYPNYRRPFGWRVMAGVTGQQNHDTYGYRANTSRKHILTRRYPDSTSVVDTLEASEVFYEGTHYDREVTHSDYAVLVAEYNHPLSLNWQLSYHASVGAELNGPGTEDDGQGTNRFRDQRIYELAVGTEGRYIFDARTDLLMSLDVSHAYREDEYRWEYNGDSPFDSSGQSVSRVWRWEVDLAGGLTYRLSPPTALSATLVVYWQQQHTERETSSCYESDELNFDMGLTVAHYIF